MKIERLDKQQVLIVYQKYQRLVTKDWFEQTYWQQRAALEGESLGRAPAYFFQHQKKHYVLRRYHRGGLVGKVINRTYLHTGLKKTRAYQELKLLRTMRKLELPVPKPVAALITTKAVGYQANIIIRLIKNAEDLFHLLKQRALSADEWQALGMMIKQFHNHGIYHSDLNIHNIMLNKKGKFWLIDFDKGKQIKPNHPKLQNNLERLLRSLRKEQQKFSDFQWQESDWAHLLQGYHCQ